MKINYILLGIASIIVVIVMSAKKATKKEGLREGIASRGYCHSDPHNPAWYLAKTTDTAGWGPGDYCWTAAGEKTAYGQKSCIGQVGLAGCLSACKKTSVNCSPNPAPKAEGEVKCRFTVDNVVDEVKYNGKKINYTGNSKVWSEAKEFSFTPVPGGVLEIKGHETRGVAGCKNSGLQLECESTKHPKWNKWGSNEKDWKTGDGRPVCISTSAFYLQGAKGYGKKIWDSNNNVENRWGAVTLVGAPGGVDNLIDVKVGPSRGPYGEWTGNTKIIKLPSSCPTFLLDPDIKTNQQYPKAVKNAQNGGWGDRFKLDVQDKTLKINRLDSLNNGWGQDLVLVAKNDGKGCSQPKKLGPPPAPLSGKKNLPKCERRPWSEWSPCNRACAGGEQYRYRSNNGYCFNADKVVFMESEKRACNQQQCPRGETGQKGSKGYRGLRGPTGDRGPRGDPIDGAGYPGDSGDVGNVGEKGKTGLMGPRGEAGYRGPEGKVMSLAQENNEFLTNIYDKLLNFGNNEELEPFNNPDYN